MPVKFAFWSYAIPGTSLGDAAFTPAIKVRARAMGRESSWNRGEAFLGASRQVVVPEPEAQQISGIHRVADFREGLEISSAVRQLFGEALRLPG